MSLLNFFWRRLGPWGLFLAIPIVLAVFVIESAIRSAIDSKVEPLFRETEPFLSPSWFRVGAVAALGILIVWGVIRVNRRYRGFGKTWWERDELEIYYLANLSVRRRADATPLDREPVLTRVRLLKDAIRNGELPAEFEGAKPNLWATVKLDDFEMFAGQRPQFRSVAKKWRKKNSKLAAPAEELGEEAKKFVAIGRAGRRAESAPEPIKKVDWLKGRMRLAALRRAGVELRNRDVSRDELGAWVVEVANWEATVARQLEEIDPADAEQFRTLDAVPDPRVRPPSLDLGLDLTYLEHFREHDYRLKILKDLLDRYASKAA